MQAEVAVPDAKASAHLSRTVWRARSVAICAALTALAFLQDPGRIVIDTKVDLAVNPVGWLARALHVWNPSGTFGQLQNQSYGYLWPMGPFFAAGHWLQVPDWVVQRLWWALLLCVAFTGVTTLARRMAIGTPMARLVAGVAFALTPRILTELGSISVEVWPMAVAPWVLVPLIDLRRGAPIRQAVTRSALAVACAGGVNATAAVAVAPLALLWLATLRPVRRRVLALVAWCLAVACATAWWVVPLLILGRYSPNFLNYIETAAVTTQVTDLVTVMRGASHWQAFFSGIQGPIWPAGWRLATEPLLIVCALALVALGLAGLSRRGMPHRRVLVAGMIVGVALVGMGHVATVDGAFAEQQRAFLDGIGAPLRNVHKFDVVLRLPLVLGLAHLVGLFDRRAVLARSWLNPARLRATAVTALTIAAIAGVAIPATTGGIATTGSFVEVPAYWHQAAGWLNQHLGRDRVLILPSARFPSYLWGSPTEEIAQPLVSGEWAVRNSIPLTPAVTIRFLDAVESTLISGEGSAGLADFLARSGVRYVLLRSDLNYGLSDAIRPAIVRQAITRSPGFNLVAEFGPMVGGNHVPGLYADSGLDVPVRSLEVFQVDRSVEPVVAYDTSEVTTVLGGPESLLEAAAAGQLSSGPTVLVGDAPASWSPGQVLVTDGLRRRELGFGVLHDNASATMTADEPFSLPSPAHDYLPAWGEDWQTVVRYLGISGVTASSSWSQAQGLGNGRPAYQPYAALDGDPTTSWQSSPSMVPEGQWLEVSLDRPRSISVVRVHVDLSADSVPSWVTVTAGNQSQTIGVAGDTAVAVFPGGSVTRTVEVQIVAATAVRAGFGGAGITELEIPGVTAQRTLVVPTPPSTSQAAAVVMSAAPSVASCFFLNDQPRCAAGVARDSEDGSLIDRTLTFPTSATYRPMVWIKPRSGGELNALLDREVAAETLGDGQPRVTASSTGFPDPAARPGAVLDGDPATAWSAAVGDGQPWLRLSWPNTRTVTGIRLALDERVAGARPFAVNVIGADGIRNGVIAPNGVVSFDQPLHTDQITVFFSSIAPARSYNPYTNRFDDLPVAIGELSALPEQGRPIQGPTTLAEAGSPGVDLGKVVALPCGSGPTIDVGGLHLRTAISATIRDLIQLREVPAELCGQGDQLRLNLPAGPARVVVTGNGLVTPTRFALTPDGMVTAATPSAVRIDRWTATDRAVHVDGHSTDRVIVVRENTNPGWRATLNGHVLTPIVIDGWQQGWLLPTGAAGEIAIRFAPDAAYRMALAVGAGLVLFLVVLAVWPHRRRGSHTESPTARSRRQPWVVSAVVGGLALLMAGGVVASLLIVGGVTVVYAWHVLPRSGAEGIRRRRLLTAVAWLLPAVLFAIAGWLSVIGAAPRTDVGPQLVVLAALTASWFSITVPVRKRGQRAPQR